MTNETESKVNSSENTSSSTSNINNFSLVPNTISSAMPLLSQIYGELASPSVKKVGQALETVFELGNTALLPLKLWSAKKRITFEKNLDKYRQKLENVNESDIIEVSPEIGVPIIEKFAYITNEDLSELFATLLAKASTSKDVHTVHPAFIKIIENIAVDEAMILRYFFENPYILPVNNTAIPLINFRLERKNGSGGVTVYSYLTAIEKNIALLYPDNINLYFENLMSLGILEYNDMRFLTNKNAEYEKLENDYHDQKEILNEKIHLNEELESITVEKSYFEITNFGIRFLDACIKN